MMKTKPFLLATAGSTVDGRSIDDAMLEQMVSSYDPKTYGARLNIEHVRSAMPDAPSAPATCSKSIGSWISRQAQGARRCARDEADEPRSSTCRAKAIPRSRSSPTSLARALPMMGCALTDSPASIATQRLQFNRALPGTGRSPATRRLRWNSPTRPGTMGYRFPGRTVGLRGSPPAQRRPAQEDDPPGRQPAHLSQMRTVVEELTSGIAKEPVRPRGHAQAAPSSRTGIDAGPTTTHRGGSDGGAANPGIF
jgi:hypothetical protein